VKTNTPWSSRDNYGGLNDVIDIIEITHAQAGKFFDPDERGRIAFEKYCVAVNIDSTRAFGGDAAIVNVLHGVEARYFQDVSDYLCSKLHHYDLWGCHFHRRGVALTFASSTGAVKFKLIFSEMFEDQ